MPVLSTAITLNDQLAKASSWGYSCQLSGDLPGRLGTAAALTQRTAKVSWHLPDELTRWGVNPWIPGYPSPEQQVSIEALIDGEGSRVFTGRIDSTSSEVMGAVTSELIDSTDDFSQVVRLDPLLAVMPSAPGAKPGIIGCGTSALHVVSEVLRQCGYSLDNFSRVSSASPNGLIFHAPMRGSTWSDWRNGLGRNTQATLAKGARGTYASFARNSDGTVSLGRGYAAYERTEASLANGITLEAYIHPTHAGEVKIVVEGEDVRFTLTIGSARVPRVAMNDSTLPASAGGGWVIPAETQMVQVRFLPTGQWKIHDGSRQVMEGEFDPAMMTGKTVRSMEVISQDGARVRSISVWSNGWGGSADPAKKAVVSLPGQSLFYRYTPSIRDRKARDVLEEISAALCSPMWIDGNGVFHMVFAGYLREQATSGTLSVKNLVKAPYTFSVLNAASRVIGYAKESVRARQKPGGGAVELWRGSGSTLEPNEIAEEWVGPDAEGDWIEPDLTFSRGYAHGAPGVRTINAQTGSYYIVTTETGSEHYGGFSIEEVTPWRWKMTTRNPKDVPVTQQVPDIDRYKWWLRGKPTPRFMGGALITTENKDPVVVETNAANAPVLEHDMGIWGQGEVGQQVIGYVAAHATRDFLVRFKQVETFYNPSLDVGQVWVLDLLKEYGRRFKVLILSVDADPAADRMTLTFSMVKDITDWSYATLAQTEPSYQGLVNDYSSYQAVAEGAK